MSWYDTHQAAVDPDNPAANEQITFDEWNAMVSYLKDKIVDKTVNTAAIGNDKVLVYKTATSTFVFESQSTVGAIGDLSDVTISGVPADNEVVAYDIGTSKWINQTAAEAGLATVAGLAAYYPLTGATLTGNLNMGDYLLDDVDDIQAYDTGGIAIRDSAAASKIVLATTTYAFTANATANMGSQNLINVLDPTSAQHASTKNYDDTHVATKELVTSFTDGYGLVYKTASGKFEMEGIGNVWTGLADTPASITASQVVKGNAGGTAIEFSGISETDYFLKTGARAMTSAMDMGGQPINKVGPSLDRDGDVGALLIKGGQSNAGQIWVYGKDNAVYPGALRFIIPDAAKSSCNEAVYIAGATDTPIVEIKYGLDMNAKDIDDIGALILNDATELTIDTNGIVTATQSYHTIDTYADAVTDNLDSIQGGTAGMKLTIRAADSARTVVVRDGAENIQLEGDMTLDNAQDTLSLIHDGSKWLETGRANNGA
jgi:hypothetical protein